MTAQLRALPWQLSPRVTSTGQAGQGRDGTAARQRALTAGWRAAGKCRAKAENAGQCARRAGRAAGRTSRLSFPCRAAGPARHAGATRGQARPAPSARLRRPVPRNVTPPEVTQKKINKIKRNDPHRSLGTSCFTPHFNPERARRCCCSCGKGERREKGHGAPRVSLAVGAFCRPPNTMRNILVTAEAPERGNMYLIHFGNSSDIYTSNTPRQFQG